MLAVTVWESVLAVTVLLDQCQCTDCTAHKCRILVHTSSMCICRRIKVGNAAVIALQPFWP